MNKNVRISSTELKAQQGTDGSASTDPRVKNEKVKFSFKARHRLMSKSTSVKGRVVGLIIYFFTITFTFIIFFGEILLLPKDETQWCKAAQHGYIRQKSYENPYADNNPCLLERTVFLLFTNLDECDMARRMIGSVIFGAAIGYERKTKERPVGMRTMSLICLGSCLFTINSIRAFRSSPMRWDAARVAAAIPSGVGFLGTALIWKGTTGKKGSPNERQEVHGLTTAAGVWLAAAIGVGAGGKLFILSAYAVSLVIIVLRVGPKLYFSNDPPGYMSDMEEIEQSQKTLTSTDVDNDDSDADMVSTEEKTRLLQMDAGTPVISNAFTPQYTNANSSQQIIQSDNNTLYEEMLQDPKRKSMLLKRRNYKTRSLSPRAMMRANRPTFRS